ncbi:hypothetical protein JXB02_05920 [Candidatus Woesearchaeota archaeon]|nr:hypothetical protein [Candidatus Woesearchaeota archaeon]
MGKKCIICGQPAEYAIKDSSEFYCQDCAHEHFSDLEMLQKVETQAQTLKAMIKKKVDDVPEGD